MNLRNWYRRRWRSLGAGFAVTVLACIGWGTGVLVPLDDFAFDAHFRYGRGLPADERLVLIDIDDHALEQIHAWPWPRRLHAQLIDVLAELNARAIVMDIVFDEHQAPRFQGRQADPHYDLEDELSSAGEGAYVFDDEELAAAITRAGNVYLALSLDFESAQAGHSLPEEQAARQAAEKFLQEHPAGTWYEFFQTAEPDGDFQRRMPRRKQLLRAYRQVQAARTVLAQAPQLTENLHKAAVPAYDVIWPMDRVVEAARGVGFVSYDRTQARTVVRELPLLAEVQGKMLRQLGFVAACDLLGVFPSSLGYTKGKLTWPGNTETGDYPLSAEGRALINWHTPATPQRWQECFAHIPVARLMELALSREAMAENQQRLELERAEMVERCFRDTPTRYGEYAALLRERNQLRSELRRATYSTKQQAIERAILRVGEALSRIDKEAGEWLAYAWKQWEQVEPANARQQTERLQFETWQRKFLQGEGQRAIDEINAALNTRNETLRAELHDQVKDKVCIVGYTATAVADMIPTPVCDALPGSLVHANVANMVLQNRSIARVPAACNVGLIALAGVLVTVLTSIRRGGFGASALLLIVVLLLGGGLILFSGPGYYLSTAAAALAACVTWAVVTLIRQTTEERARRTLQRTLGQYTAPAVAARISERFQLTDLDPQPAQVTCFFCDLRGFTPLAEQLGAARTRELLNPYLARISTLLHEHGAIVNKFLGDGVFAFFNAPIHSCPQHAAAGCAAALASQQALHELNEAARTSGLPQLTMGVGLATGETFVGNYGVSTKLDYTCIGDTVNVASRLEGANKVLDTRMLADAATCQAAGPGFVFRPLGLFRLTGKQTPVEVSELVGKIEEVSDQQLAAIERWTDILRHFTQRDWSNCTKLLAEWSKEFPEDGVAWVYAEQVDHLQRTPPRAGFDGAISLGPPPPRPPG